jgi:hypothetical protein
MQLKDGHEKEDMAILLIITVVILQASFQMGLVKTAPEWSQEELLAAFTNLCERALSLQQ